MGVVSLPPDDLIMAPLGGLVGVWWTLSTLAQPPLISLCFSSKVLSVCFSTSHGYYTLFSETCQGVGDTFGVLICEGLTIVRKRAKTYIHGDLSRSQQHSTTFFFIFNSFPQFPQVYTFLWKNPVENYLN